MVAYKTICRLARDLRNSISGLGPQVSRSMAVSANLDKVFRRFLYLSLVVPRGVSFHKATAAATTVQMIPVPSSIRKPKPNTMENNSTTGHLHSEFGSMAPVAVSVFIFSSFLFVTLVFMYCHYHCDKEQLPLLRSQPLPVISYRKTDDLPAGCVICLSEFEEGEDVKLIPGCGHVFHPQCIDRWLGGHRSCPVCRCTEFFGRNVQEVAAPEAMESAVDSAVEVGGSNWETRFQRSRSLCDRVAGEGEREVVLHRAYSF